MKAIPALPSINVWCTLATIAISPPATFSTTNICHSGSLRSSGCSARREVKSASSLGPPGRGQRGPLHVMIDVDVAELGPHRRCQMQRGLDEPVPQRRHEREPRCDEVAQLLEACTRPARSPGRAGGSPSCGTAPPASLPREVHRRARSIASRHLHPSFGILRSASFVRHPSFGILRSASFVRHPSFGILRSASFVRHPSFGILRSASFVRHPSFGILRSASFVRHPSFGIPRSASLARHPSLGARRSAPFVRHPFARHFLLAPRPAPGVAMKDLSSPRPQSATHRRHRVGGHTTRAGTRSGRPGMMRG